MSPSAATAGLVRPLAEERALVWCVLASIVLHALVLLGMSSRRAPAPPADTVLVLTASLAPFAALPPPAPLQPPPRPEPALRPATTKPIAAPRHAPAPALAPQEVAPAEPIKAPEPVPVLAPQPDSAPAAPSSVASTAQPAVPVKARPALPASGGNPATEAAARPGEEADAGTLAQYRLALIVATRRYKRYPAIAMEKGWQGKVEVHMVIGANGMVASASINTSSGYEILDNQALDMLNKGGATVPIPPSLRGREFGINIPVIFSLDNPNS
jgi:periplasmic protein TonB